MARLGEISTTIVYNNDTYSLTKIAGQFESELRTKVASGLKTAAVGLGVAVAAAIVSGVKAGIDNVIDRAETVMNQYKEVLGKSASLADLAEATGSSTATAYLVTQALAQQGITPEDSAKALMNISSKFDANGQISVGSQTYTLDPNKNKMDSMLEILAQLSASGNAEGLKQLTGLRGFASQDIGNAVNSGQFRASLNNVGNINRSVQVGNAISRNNEANDQLQIAEFDDQIRRQLISAGYNREMINAYRGRLNAETDTFANRMAGGKAANDYNLDTAYKQAMVKMNDKLGDMIGEGLLPMVIKILEHITKMIGYVEAIKNFFIKVKKFADGDESKSMGAVVRNATVPKVVGTSPYGAAANQNTLKP